MIGDPLAIAAVLATGLAAACLTALGVRPVGRLGPRVRPYTVITRTTVGAGADPAGSSGAAVVSVFRPLVAALSVRLGRLIEGGEEAIRRKIRQSGLYHHLPDSEQLDAYRIRQLATVAAYTAGGTGLGVVLGMSVPRLLVVTLMGLVVGVTKQRGRLERAVEERRQRMRIEIYSVNQLLAMRVRVGGGVVHAVQQLVASGRGEVAGELAEALRLHRAGLTAAQAFGRAARLTPEPHCARTYGVLAAAEERGADLAQALLALAEDVRESRREAMRRAATKRRAAMLIPTIAILAPVMLLFVGAPLPQLVLNWR